MTLPLPLRLRLRALFRAVTVSLLRCCFCCRSCCFSCICVGVRDCCCCCYLWGACWTGCSTTHKYIDIRRTCTHTHAQTNVHTQEEKTHAVLVFVSTPWYVCVCVRVCNMYVCSVFNESTTKNGRNVFCFYPSAVDVGFFGRWPLAHTHLQIPAHTHTRSRIHVHDRRSINFDICNFHFSVRAYHEQSNQLIYLALNVSQISCCSISFTLRIHL